LATPSLPPTLESLTFRRPRFAALESDGGEDSSRLHAVSVCVCTRGVHVCMCVCMCVFVAHVPLRICHFQTHAQRSKAHNASGQNAAVINCTQFKTWQNTAHAQHAYACVRLARIIHLCIYNMLHTVLLAEKSPLYGYIRCVNIRF
jgi:hypothetical protein